MLTKNEYLKQQAKIAWGTKPAGWTFGEGHQVGTESFFKSVLHKRFTYECDWLDGLVDFKKFRGKKVLEIGSGAGYDAYMFCSNGAQYTGIDITPQNQQIAQKHLASCNLQTDFLCEDAEEMNFKKEFDFVYSFGVLHHTPNIEKALRNSYQALKKGGQIHIIVYYKYSLVNMLDIILTKWVLRLGFLRRTLAQQRSLVEYTTSSARPLVNVYSKKEMIALMQKVGFVVQQIDVAKLVHEDLKDVFLLGLLIRLVPQKLLSIMGKKFGWYLAVRAVKNS